MTVTINGTTGVAGVDGTAATPAIQGNDTNTGIFFPAADTIAFAEGGAEVARFDSSGNLGIGTTSPSGRLSTAVPDGVTNAFYAERTGGSPVQLSVTFANAYSNLLSSGVLAFHTAGTQRAMIDASGNLLVGTTSTSAGVRLRVAGGIIGCVDVFNNTSGAGANVNIDSNGFFARSTSSLKYKTDVQNATHGLAEVMQLRAVTYKGKAESDGDKVFGGLIAEEVHEAGLIEFVQYAEDGSPDALNYGNMVSLAFKAIQEQQAIITDLKSRIEALEQA
jgi:hypothetical protein